MDLRTKIQVALKEQYGEFETYLEHIYEEKVTDILVNGPSKNRETWSTYNQIILELKHSLKDNLRVKELQYKLTENEDPKKVCIDVIKDIYNLSPELERLFYKINNF